MLSVPKGGLAGPTKPGAVNTTATTSPGFTGAVSDVSLHPAVDPGVPVVAVIVQVGYGKLVVGLIELPFTNTVT
jgi:hypothetical protein